MSWKSLPPAMPEVLLRHPVLLAEWLRLTNRWRRWREERAASPVLTIVATLAALALMAGVLAGFSRQLARATAGLAEYWLLTTAVAAIYASTSLAKRRRQARNEQLRSWLVAAPVAPTSVHLSLAIRVITPTMAQFCAIAAFILFAEILSGGVTAAAGTAIASIGGGSFVGGCVGWLAKSGRWDDRWEDSRYVARVNARGSLQPDSAALAGWPIAQVLAWSRPENSRYVLVAALFAVQGGSSAMAGLAVVALYLLAGYLAGLISALLHVAKSAAVWLRSTPLTLSEFVWALSRRALIHQVAGTALAAAFMSLLGPPLLMTLQISVLWLVLAISMSGVALIDSYRGRSPAVKIALSLATLAALTAAWQLRAGEKA